MAMRFQPWSAWLVRLAAVIGIGLIAKRELRAQPIHVPLAIENNVVGLDQAPAPDASAAVSAPNHVRSVSPAMAEKLSLNAPKFIPTKSDADSVAAIDLRDTDKPKNQIVRLPEYQVKERKSPVLKESDVMTPAAKLALSLKRHPGLRFGSLWFFNNNGIALAMLAEEERLERKAEMTDLADLYRYTDPPKRASLQRDVERTFIRSSGP